MARADVDGIALEYEDSGTGEPVVCIHGALIADTFRPLAAEAILADASRQHGGLPPPLAALLGRDMAG